MEIYIFIGISAMCFFACLFIYRLSKDAAWLAGSTVASCLFLIGVTLSASFFVRGIFINLLAFFSCIVLLVLIHLRAATKNYKNTEQPDDEKQLRKMFEELYCGESNNLII